MAVKNAVAKHWVLSPSFDGYLYSAYPAGDKPTGAISGMLLLYTDTTEGAVSGGENNKGHYLTIFGLNLAPSFAALGDTHRVYIGGVEVDNYRYLKPAVGTPTGAIGAGVFQTWGIQALCVQVGALTGLTLGVEYAIDIKVSGASAPINATSGAFFIDPDGNNISFTPNPGPTVFVSLTGNDAGAGTIADPLRHLQTGATITTLTGALFNSRAATSPVAANACQPGTQIVLRGGEWGADYSTVENRWARLYRITGTTPTGALGSGRIHITAYPGPAGGNAPESVVWTGVSGSAGGIQGNDTARAGETTPYGQTGYCQYIHISHLKIIPHPTSGSDAAPVNMQSKADYWRLVNCDLSWMSTVTGGSSARAGGFAGNGESIRVYGNWIHDIWGDTSTNLNHGGYIDGNLLCAQNFTMAFNCIKGVTAGNGWQSFNQVASDTFRGIKMHHNWIEDTNKHGINISQSTKDGHWWANIVIDSGGYAAVNQSAEALQDIQVEYNTVYGWASVETTRAAFASLATVPSGTSKFQNNIVAQAIGRSNTGYSFFSPNDATCTASNNRWYDYSGNLATKPAGDAAGSYGTPTFVDYAAKDFRLAVGSACIDAGTAALTSVGLYDFLLAPRTVNATKDIGAMEKQ